MVVACVHSLALITLTNVARGGWNVSDYFYSEVQDERSRSSTTVSLTSVLHQVSKCHLFFCIDPKVDITLLMHSTAPKMLNRGPFNLDARTTMIFCYILIWSRKKTYCCGVYFCRERFLRGEKIRRHHMGKCGSTCWVVWSCRHAHTLGRHGHSPSSFPLGPGMNILLTSHTYI